MYCFNFTISGYCDNAGTTAEPSHRIIGRELLGALQPSLSAAGFTCGDLELERTSWQFHARKNGTIYLIGGQSDTGAGSRNAQVFIDHSRSFVDRVLNRNKRAPQNYSEKSLRDALTNLPGISELQESQHFGEIEAAKDAFSEIRQ